MIEFENPQPIGEVGSAYPEAVEPGAEQRILVGARG